MTPRYARRDAPRPFASAESAQLRSTDLARANIAACKETSEVTEQEGSGGMAVSEAWLVLTVLGVGLAYRFEWLFDWTYPLRFGAYLQLQKVATEATT